MNSHNLRHCPASEPNLVTGQRIRRLREIPGPHLGYLTPLPVRMFEAPSDGRLTRTLKRWVNLAYGVGLRCLAF